jgi:FkbM family methyltransferase
MKVSLDDWIGRSIYTLGTLEFATYEILKRLVQPGMVALDIGANIGCYTLLLAQCVGPAGRVYAFEPVLATHEKLKANIALNPHLSPVIHPQRLGVSDENTNAVINVTTGKNSGASYIGSPDTKDQSRLAYGIQGAEEIQVTTLDSFWNNLGKPKIDLIKIDVEGYELHALRGMKALLDAHPDIVLLLEVRDAFLRESGGSTADLYNFMLDHGFGAYDFHPRKGIWIANSTPHDGETVVFTRRSLQS